MPTYADLPSALQVQITQAITAQKFAFYTSEAGRSPSFYFAQGGLANINNSRLDCRVRPFHASGPLISIFTGGKGHLFFPNQAVRDQVHGVMRAVRDHANPRYPHMRLAMDAFEAVYPRAPAVGNHHYEYMNHPAHNDRIVILHRSGGTVLLNPRPTQEHCRRLIDRVLAEGCEVTVNGVRQVAPDNTVARAAAIPNVANYLASL